jgi:hypothetical protein
MKFVAKSIALAALVLVASGQSYAEPLRSTSIPSSLADDEKRLMLKVMNEFYGTFDKEKHPISIDQKEEKGCWISTKSGPYPQGSNVRTCRHDRMGDNRQAHNETMSKSRSR